MIPFEPLVEILLKIRPEHTSDEQEIFDLTVTAFESIEYSDGSEGSIINNLRKDGDLTISLVAVNSDDVVGHIAFSPVKLSGNSNNWYGLGPVAVHPDHQKTGIGSKLINEGLTILKAKGAEGCVLVGDPNYYVRFGFKSDGRLHYGGLPAKFVQWLSFGDENAEGEVKYSPAFNQ